MQETTGILLFDLRICLDGEQEIRYPVVEYWHNDTVFEIRLPSEQRFLFPWSRVRELSWYQEQQA